MFKVLTIDFDDTSLKGAAEQLEDTLNAIDGEIYSIIPTTVSYTDRYKYTETGVLVVVKD